MPFVLFLEETEQLLLSGEDEKEMIILIIDEQGAEGKMITHEH